MQSFVPKLGRSLEKYWQEKAWSACSRNQKHKWHFSAALREVDKKKGKSHIPQILHEAQENLIDTHLYVQVNQVNSIYLV